MAISDKIVGGTLLLIAAALLSYYTAWVFVTPFIAADHPLQSYFPERAYAIAIPTLLFTAAVAVGGLLVSLIMIKSAAAKKKR